ncbi:MAG: hypothetical protein R3C11_05820 [Planctomycetaceae bacterium]
MSIFCGLLISSLTGCIRYHEWSNELHVKKLACKAYSDRYSFDPSFQHARHYERGWKEGYTDVALGGDGNPPTFPPVPYRSFKYRSPEGHQIIDLWFDAYRQGANAALQEGVQHWNYLPTSQHQHYREIIHATEPAVIPYEPTPVNALPITEEEPLESSEPSSVPQVLMELKQTTDSAGSLRLSSGTDPIEDDLILLNLDVAE